MTELNLLPLLPLVQPLLEASVNTSEWSGVVFLTRLLP